MEEPIHDLIVSSVRAPLAHAVRRSNRERKLKVAVRLVGKEHSLSIALSLNSESRSFTLRRCPVNWLELSVIPEDRPFGRPTMAHIRSSR